MIWIIIFVVVFAILAVIGDGGGGAEVLGGVYKNYKESNLNFKDFVKVLFKKK